MESDYEEWEIDRVFILFIIGMLCENCCNVDRDVELILIIIIFFFSISISFLNFILVVIILRVLGCNNVNCCLDVG